MTRGSSAGSAPRRPWQRLCLGLRGGLWALALCLPGALSPAGAVAQEMGLVNSPILVVDTGRLFVQSQFGQRVSDEIERRGIALAEENRRIEAELTAEEKTLTQERPGMKPELFRQKADAFDAKVRKTRNTQEAKANALTQEGEAAERRFLNVARPVLEELMVESGAAVLLDTRAVLLSAGSVDVTDEAVARIDATIGDGGAFEQGTPEQPSAQPPEQLPEPTPPVDPDVQD